MNRYTIKLFEMTDRPMRCETVMAPDYLAAASAAEARLRSSRFKKASIFQNDDLVCSVDVRGLPFSERRPVRESSIDAGEQRYS